MFYLNLGRYVFCGVLCVVPKFTIEIILPFDLKMSTSRVEKIIIFYYKIAILYNKSATFRLAKFMVDVS